MLNLRLFGDEVLKLMANEDIPRGDIVRQHAIEMIAIMYNSGGVGLAANQVGLLWPIFVMHAPGDVLRVCIEPTVDWESADDELMKEGCLSLPGATVEVWRPREIDVEYTDLSGKRNKERLTGLPARVYLHEFDHLRGELLIDKLHGSERLTTIASIRNKIKDDKRERQ